jgi:hypothetical protein
MRRRGAITALAAALVALASGAHAADQEHTQCQKLSPKHDLAPAKRVKLVEQKRSNGDARLVGCILPAGKLVIAASRYDDGDVHGDYELRQVAGHHVLIDGSLEGDFGTNHFTYVMDLRYGNQYTVASRCQAVEPGWCGSKNPKETAERALVNSSGQAAAVVRSESSDLVTVEGFSRRGTRVVLDSGTRSEIPASSLDLDGHVASWRNSGALKSARLPGVSKCQKLDARPPKDLAPGTRRAKLVERENADGGTDVVGCVLPAGKVSLVASSTKEPGSERGYQILQVVGHEVLVRGELINQYGHGVSTYVYDLKQARSYNVAESCFDPQGAACDQTYAKRAFVNAQGQAAAIVRTDGSSERQVIGFKSTGAGTVLDTGTRAEIPASSLSLEGHVVRWTHSGVPKSATLSG